MSVMFLAAITGISTSQAELQGLYRFDRTLMPYHHDTLAGAVR